MTTQFHTSVMLEEAIDALAIKEGDVIVDATLGGAGHFSQILSRAHESNTVIGIDADSAAILRAQKVAHGTRATVHLVNDNFRNIASIVDSLGLQKIDKILFDLGWSSFQLDDGRGFSFRSDEPLVMTYAGVGEMSAAYIVNTYPVDELADIIHTYGEERFARSIARAIGDARKRARIADTQTLVNIITDATPAWYHRARIHPATKTFQALRIAANDELGAVREGLSGALTRLSPGGIIAVITFHSIEDRIVKNIFREAVHGGSGELVHKKPLTPRREEILANPRARSAKLRVYRSCSKDNTVSSHKGSHYTYA